MRIGARSISKPPRSLFGRPKDERLGPQLQRDAQLHRPVLPGVPAAALQPRGHHHLHAHPALHLRDPVLGRGHRQRVGHLRGGGVQEEDGVGHLRAEPSHSRHALLAGHALQHPPAGPGPAVGVRELHVQGGGGGGRQQPVHHGGDRHGALHRPVSEQGRNTPQLRV